MDPLCRELTHAYRATGQKDQATTQVDELRSYDCHQLSKPADESGTTDEKRAVQPSELFTLLDWSAENRVISRGLA